MQSQFTQKSVEGDQNLSKSLKTKRFKPINILSYTITKTKDKRFQLLHGAIFIACGFAQIATGKRQTLN
jgi:hypothetical protein